MSMELDLWSEGDGRMFLSDNSMSLELQGPRASSCRTYMALYQYVQSVYTCGVGRPLLSQGA